MSEKVFKGGYSSASSHPIPCFLQNPYGMLSSLVYILTFVLKEISFYINGFFVFRGSFKFKFVKIGPLNFFLQIRVKSSRWRTTLQVKSSSTMPVSFFFSKKQNRAMRNRFSFTLKVKLSLGMETSLFGFFFLFFFTFSFMYIF